MATNGSKDVAEGARETMRQVQGKLSDGFEDFRGYWEVADSTMREFAREKPLLAIVCAAGVGFLIGRLASRI
jgi:ElaB/YqjD/DUF883 family membrane-anchored ribosome-binding protein